MVRHLACCLLVQVGSTQLWGQAANWLTWPTELAFTSGGVNADSTPLIGTAVNNSVYDAYGDLVFYVRGHEVKDANGNTLGTVGPNFFPITSSYLPEIAIVEVPGNCSQYYVILGETQPFFGVDLYHVKVDISTNPISVIPVATSPIPLPDHSLVLAVSTYLPNFPGDRWLYTLTDGGDLDRFEIKTSGIYFETNIFTPSTFPAPNPLGTFAATEGDVLGNCFAWGETRSNRVFVAVFKQVDGTFDKLYTMEVPEGSSVCGVEFDPGVDYLFAAACGGEEGDGIYRFHIKTGTPSRVRMNAEGDLLYSNTQLENGIDEHLYMVSESGELGRLPIGGTTISPVGAPSGASMFSPWWAFASGFPVYTLPDQIDNETFAAEPYATVQSYTINQVPLQSAPNPVPDFYECNPLILRADVSDAVTYTLRIEDVPGTGSDPVLIQTAGINVNGNPFFIFQDLFDVSGQFSLGDSADLVGKNGTYRATLTLNTNCAGPTVRSGVFELEAAPDTAGILVEVAPGNGGSLCATKTLANVCNIGVFSGGIQFTNSGDIDYYRIDSIAQVDCSSGAWLETIYAETNTTGAPQSYLGINSLEVQSTNPVWDSTGFFALNAGAVMGRCYLLTVTVGNACGEATDFTYFRIESDSAYKMATSLAEPAQWAWEESAQVYPNPAADRLSVAYQLATPGRMTTVIRDLSGRVLLSHATDRQVSGQHQQVLDVSSLAQGLYVYQVQAGDQVVTGRLVKQ